MREALVAVAAVALYLVFAGQISSTELYAAAGLGGLAVLRTYAVARTMTQSFAFGSGDLIAATGSVMGIPSAISRTTRAFAHVIARGTSTGSSRRIPFRVGQTGDPFEHARRATALLCASLAPDSYILRLERGRDEALMHEITGRRDRDAERLS